VIELELELDHPGERHFESTARIFRQCVDVRL
jgi:hypothetical protein